MNVKVILRGFGKKSLQAWRLNKKAWCFNLYGTALFVDFYKG